MLLLVGTETHQQLTCSTSILKVMGNLGWTRGYLDTSKVEVWMGFYYIPGDKPQECTNTGSFWIFRTKFHYCFLNVSTLIWSLCWPNIDVKNSTPWPLYYVWISRDVKQYYLLALQHLMMDPSLEYQRKTGRCVITGLFFSSFFLISFLITRSKCK